jgi:hypothetical protein
MPNDRLGPLMPTGTGNSHKEHKEHKESALSCGLLTSADTEMGATGDFHDLFRLRARKRVRAS